MWLWKRLDNKDKRSCDEKLKWARRVDKIKILLKKTSKDFEASKKVV